MFNFEGLWDLSKAKIIERVLLSVGLSTLSPWSKILMYILGKFLDKYIKPEYDKTIANQHKVYREHIESLKLGKINDAINSQDTSSTIHIIDTLK